MRALLWKSGILGIHHQWPCLMTGIRRQFRGEGGRELEKGVEALPLGSVEKYGPRFGKLETAERPYLVLNDQRQVGSVLLTV